MNLGQIAKVGPEVSALIDDYGRRLLEQEAALVDSTIRDKLLMELVMSYVAAERELRTLNDVKDRFLGIAAHDLRNPLGALRGLAELLQMEPTAEQRREMVQAIYDTANDMLALVNNLLDVAVIESGRLDVRLVPCDLAQIVRSRVRLLALGAQKKQIAIEQRLDAVPDCMLDSQRIAQVVDNLVGNAIKFSPPGSVVTVSVLRTGDRVELAVRDQGPGFSASDRERLFGAFERLSATPTGGEKSTGLGLAIVKKIIDGHGGTIRVLGEPGAGADFRVSLPAGALPPTSA